MRRDEEFKRLLSYAKGLGLKVTVYNYGAKDGTMALWSCDGSDMTLYNPPGLSKTELVLSAIHELGHHCNWIYDHKRELGPKLQNIFELFYADKPLSKSQRTSVYEYEAEGIRWWDVIIKDVNIQIPKHRVSFQKDMDLWIYEYYMKHDKWPTSKVKNEKRRELRAKWKM